MLAVPAAAARRATAGAAARRLARRRLSHARHERRRERSVVERRREARRACARTRSARRAQAVERRAVEGRGLWKGRGLRKGKRCGRGELWKGRAVEGERCGRGELWKGRAQLWEWQAVEGAAVERRCGAPLLAKWSAPLEKARRSPEASAVLVTSSCGLQSEGAQRVLRGCSEGARRVLGGCSEGARRVLRKGHSRSGGPFHTSRRSAVSSARSGRSVGTRVASTS